MRKNIKRFLTTAFCAAAFALFGFGVSAVSTTEVAKADQVELQIVGRTLNVSNNVNLTFLVPAEAGDKADIKVVATEVNAVDGTEEEPVTIAAAEENYVLDGNEYYQYIYRGVSATEMPNVVYAYAYSKSNPENVSEEKKFSIIEYAHKQLGLVDGYTKVDALEELLLATLNYGEAAAKFADNTSLPADYVNDYKFVKIENATFADGYSYAMLAKGEEVTVIPNEGFGLKAGSEYFNVNAETGEITLAMPNGDLTDFDVTDAFEDIKDKVSDADKVAHEADVFAYEATNSVTMGDSVALPVVYDTYEDVTIAWFDHNDEEILADSYTFAEDGNYTFTVKFTCGESVAEKEITFNVTATAEQKVAHELVAFTFEETNNVTMGDSVQLPTETAKYSDVTIAWKNGEEILADSYTFAEDGNYTFTVEFSCGGVVETKTIAFNVTATAAQKVAYEMNAFTFANTSVKAETAIALPTAYDTYEDVTIAWFDHNDEEILADSYTFAEDGNYTFTVKFTCGESVAEKEISFVVEASDRQKVEAAAAALSFTLTEAMVGDTATLPTASGVTVTWEATGASISGSTVTFGAKGTATLTATITCGEVKQTKEFTVTVTGPLATFEFDIAGANSTGTAISGTKTYTSEGYDLTLSITGSVYDKFTKDSVNALKFGSSSKTGSVTFTVSAEVTSVIIKICAWDSDASTAKINNQTITLKTTYQAIEVDTTSNKTVTITSGASGDKRAIVDSISFIGKPATAETKVQAELDALNSFTLPAEVTSATEIALRTAGATYNDVTIAWSVNDEAAEFVSIVDGKLIINLPAEDATVLVTATLTCGEAEDAKEYEIYVDVLDASEKVAEVKEALAGSTEVEGDAEVALPANPRNDVSVSWALSDTTWASLNGNKVSITNPDKDITITVTATITCGTASDTATYTIQVKFVDTSAPAEPVTILVDFSKQGYSDASAVTSVKIDSNITATFGKGTNSQGNVPKYYNSGSAIRCYKLNTLSITSTAGNIQTIKFTFASTSYAFRTGEIPNGCTYTNNTIDMSAKNSKTITINHDESNTQWRIKAIEVTYLPA